MDPTALLSTAYTLYQAIDENLKTVMKNKRQFELLGQRIGDLAGPIKILQDIHKSTKKLQCTESALRSLISTLESIQSFVSQARFQKSDGDTAASSMLLLISQMYHASEDNESFVHFDKLLTNNLQSLSFGVNIAILDYTTAAVKDEETTFAESGLSSKPVLREIDISKLQWNPDSTDKLGQGAFSVVRKGKYDEKPVAIKQVLNLATLSPKDARTITKEAMLMQFANHTHIMRVVGVCLPKGLLVMELALCSLFEYLYPITVQGEAATVQQAKLAPVHRVLEHTNPLEWKLEIVLQLCDALQYLHRFHILHRDIKSPNVMLFHDIYANKVITKIGDFGLALAVDLITRTAQGTMMNTTTFQSAVGTYNYMAPELFKRQPGEKVAYSESSDVYSLGILINEIMSSAMPWSGGAREIDIMNWVSNSLRPDMWTMSSSPTAAERELFAIVGRSDSAHPSCLHQSPYHRPTASEVFNAASGSKPQPRSPIHNRATKMDKKILPIVVEAADEDAVAISKEDTSHLEAFALEFIVQFNDISHEKAKAYVKKLFQQSIFTVGRFEEQLFERNQKAAGAMSWLKTLGFHDYDINDVTAMLSAKKSKKVYQEQRLPTSEEVLTMQGVAVLESWIQSNVPNLNIPRFRVQWAQLLWDNNITTVRRLLKYGEDLDFLKSVKITDMDARDIFKSIRDTNEKAKRALWEPSTVQYQWTSNAEQHNKDVVEYVRLCLKHIFHPDEKISVKYQWTQDADEGNKGSLNLLLHLSIILLVCLLDRDCNPDLHWSVNDYAASYNIAPTQKLTGAAVSLGLL
eukprot:gene28166-37066_t